MVNDETTTLNDETTMLIYFCMQALQGMQRVVMMFVIRILNVWIIKYFITFAHYRIYLYICNSNRHYCNLHYHLRL